MGSATINPDDKEQKTKHLQLIKKQFHSFVKHFTTLCVFHVRKCMSLERMGQLLPLPMKWNVIGSNNIGSLAFIPKTNHIELLCIKEYKCEN